MSAVSMCETVVDKLRAELVVIYGTKIRVLMGVVDDDVSNHGFDFESIHLISLYYLVSRNRNHNLDMNCHDGGLHHECDWILHDTHRSTSHQYCNESYYHKWNHNLCDS